MENVRHRSPRQAPISAIQPISSNAEALLAAARRLEAMKCRLLAQLDQVIDSSAACLDRHRN